MQRSPERPEQTRLPADRAEPVDVLLVNPPWINKNESIWHGIKGAMPPLGLLSIAAYAEREGLRVRVLDVHVERWSMDQFREAVKRVSPDTVGISLMTATAISGNAIARIVKEVHPGCTVVVGGVHAETMPGECLRNRAIDLVVRGDGEKTFARIASGAAIEDILGISYRRGRRVIHNPPGELIANLDELPTPAYHLVPMKKYYPAIGAYRRLPAISMLMTRGCPGKCTFCNSANTKLRTRSAERVVDEIAHLCRTYGIREIQFYDDTFTVMKKNALRFCRLMKERRLRVSWTAFVRTDCFSEEMARALKDGGCHQVMFGVESGDDRILENIRKPIDRDKTRWAIRIAQKTGLEVRATFMFGSPGETVESMRRTIDYAVELDPDLAIFNITTPYPGTEMFEWAKHNGYLNTDDWGDYELSGAIMTLPTVTPERINEAYARAHKVFYRRAIMFWRRLRRIRNLSHLVDNVHAFFYIILRRKIGKRGAAHREWIRAKKEDFWNVSLDDPLGDEKPTCTKNTQEPSVQPETPADAAHTVPVLASA